MSRTPPSDDEILEALAAGFDAGLAPAVVLATVARAGPASAQLARRLTEELRAGSFATALASVQRLGRDPQKVIALGEETGRLPAALRWVAERSRQRRERRRALRGAVIGPLAFILLALLSEPLPSVVMGTGSFWPTLRTLFGVAAALAALWLALLRLMATPSAGALARRLPLVSSLVRLHDEAQLAGLIAAFADARELGQAPRAARAVAAPLQAQALERAAADPLAALPGFSEPLALALAVGARAGDLPARLATFQRTAAASLTARLSALLRVAAYAALVLVALHSVGKLLTTPLPGLGGDLGNVPGMRELERELENAGH